MWVTRTKWRTAHDAAVRAAAAEAQLGRTRNRDMRQHDLDDIVRRAQAGGFSDDGAVLAVVVKTPS